jgi:putative DNA primase/helicase
MTQSQNDYYKAIAEKLIEQLKEGTAPWQKPWKTRGIPSMPHNPVSGARYRGGNTVVLMAESIDKGYDDSRWVTYEQAKSIGAQVRRGEKGTILRFYKFTEEVPVKDDQGRPVLDSDGKPIKESVKLRSPKVMSFVVFNATQIDNMPPLPVIEPRKDWEVNHRAESILIASGADIRHQGNKAYYNKFSDDITLPPREHFIDDSGYYATALHELGHWSGHSSRLDRDLAHPFGSVGYAKEELRAEIFSMMLGQEIGIGHDPGQHAAYVASWIKVLEEDHREIFRAAADAEKMLGFVLGLEKERTLNLRPDLAVVLEQTFSLEGQLTSEKIWGNVAPKEFQYAKERDEIREVGQRRSVTIVPIKDLDEQTIARFMKDLENPTFRANWEPEHLNALLESIRRDRPMDSAIKVVASDAPASAPAKERTYLSVPYSEKNEAKSLGAKWDKEAKSWYIEGHDLTAFKKWISEPKPITQILPEPKISAEKTYLHVPYLERHDARKLGAKWDKEAKSWYVPEGGDINPFEKWITRKTLNPLRDPKEEFSEALRSAGLIIDGAPIMDGKLQRVPVEGGGPRSRDGAYKGHLDGHPAGYIENFRTGHKENWKSQGYTLTADERSDLQNKATKTLAERKKEQEEAYREVAIGVKEAIKSFDPAPFSSQYLIEKGLGYGHGSLFDKKDASIVLPAMDIEGNIWSYQKIDPSGRKAFAPGGRVSGCMYVARPRSWDGIKVPPKVLMDMVVQAPTIYIAEGFATAASISDAVNAPVVAAFSSTNLLKVAKAIREQSPNAKIIICGDDDRDTELKKGKNPGKDKALAAANAVRGTAIFPVFPPGSKKLTDFNDLHKAVGITGLQSQIKSMLAPKVETKIARGKESVMEIR